MSHTTVNDVLKFRSCCSSPVKGIINTTTAIPFGKTSRFRLECNADLPMIGVVKIVTSVQEGFQNAPALYGSDVRKPGKVTGFKSGLKEAGKVCELYFS